MPLLDATATADDDGSVTIFAVNRSMDSGVQLECDLRDFGPLTLSEHILLRHDRETQRSGAETSAAPLR